MEYLLIANTLQSILTQSGSTCQGPIYGPKGSDRNTWYYNYVQKKTLKKQLHKIRKYEYTMNMIP